MEPRRERIETALVEVWTGAGAGSATAIRKPVVKIGKKGIKIA